MKSLGVIIRTQRCLETAYLIFLFVWLYMAVNVSGNNKDINQYRSRHLTTTKSSPIISNVTVKTSSPANYPSTTVVTIAAIYYTYLTLYINDNHRYHSNHGHSYRIIENCNINYNAFNQIQLNKSERYRKNCTQNSINNGWCFEWVWGKNERSISSNFKAESAEKNNQHDLDDVFEIILCMFIAIFAELIPLTVRYVWNRTTVCWRRLQMFCCSHRSAARTPFQKQRLQQQHAVELNCICNVIKLSKINVTKLQKQPYTVRQNQLKMFAVITSKTFAGSYKDISTSFEIILLFADCRVVCTTTEKLTFLSGVPTIKAAIITPKACKQHVLRTLGIDRSFNTSIQTDRLIYVLMPQENQPLCKHFDIIFEYNNCNVGNNNIYLEKQEQLKRTELWTIQASHKHNNTINGSTYVEMHNSRHSKLVERNLELEISKTKLYLRRRINVLQIETLKTLRSQTFAPRQKAPKSCNTPPPYSRKNSNISIARSKKSVKTLTFEITLYGLRNTVILTLRKNPKKCLHTIVKFDLCRCWSFYRFRTFGNNKSNNCNGFHCCCQWHWRKLSNNFPHCIYCYYYSCYYYFCCVKGHLSFTVNPQYCYFRQKMCVETANSFYYKSVLATQQSTIQQLENYRTFLKHTNHLNYMCSVCPSLYYCHLTSWHQYCYNVIITTITAAKRNGDTYTNEETILMQFIRSSFMGWGKCIFHQFTHLMEYFFRPIIVELRKKLSVPRSPAIAFKVAREQQQQQHQMVCIAYDQQLKINNLWRIFCNNWKRHRRRRRRRRRRLINKSEQHVTLHPQHMGSFKDNVLSNKYNCRLFISEPNAYKTTSISIPLLHLKLSRSTTGSILTAMRIANATGAFAERTRKEMLNPPTSTMTLHATTTANTARFNRSRARPNLVWLFIGLVWFECPKCVSCTISSNNQSEHRNHSHGQPQAQTQTATHAKTEEPLRVFSASAHNPQHQVQHKEEPLRISPNLLLYKHIIKEPISLTQELLSAADMTAPVLKYKIKQRKNCNANGKTIRTDNCLSLQRRSSVLATATNDKQARLQSFDSIVMTERLHHDWFESDTEGETYANSLDEEGEIQYYVYI